MYNFNEILVEDIKDYIGVYDNNSDLTIQLILDSAKSYIMNYTGQTDIYLNSKNDISIALLGLCSDYFDGKKDNDEMVHKILNLHSRNQIFT